MTVIASRAIAPYVSSKPGSRGTWRRLLRHPSAVVGLCILLLMVGSSLAGPYLTDRDPLRVGAGPTLQGVSRSHPMGTDNLGRDIFARVLYGGRLSIGYSLVGTLLATGAGVPLGMVSGYLGGRFDGLLMRLMDLLLAFPRMLLALMMVAILGIGMVNVMLAVTVSSIPSFARVIRGVVLTVKAQDYVEAARALGASDARIITSHILPNVTAQAIILTTLSLAAAVFALSSLSFLGLGVQPPAPEWGSLVSRGRDLMREAWWMSMFPGIAIALTVLGVNLFGDGLRDVLDPRMAV